MKRKKRFLVPLDGSDRALLTCKYLAAFPPFHSRHAALFNVFSRFPEVNFGAGLERSSPSLNSARAWEVEQHKEMKKYMHHARQMLVSGGFPEEAVEVKIHKRRRGVARDKVHEAHNSYEFVIARRRGMGAVTGMILGSVTSKLLQRLTFAPLLIAGRKAPGNRVLLGFDGSKGAMHAIRFVGSLLGPFPEYGIRLIHVLTDSGKAPSGFKGIWIPEEITVPASEKTIMQQLDAAKLKLVSLGVAPERITSELVSGAGSRALEIAKYAQAENFGILALGRRGVTNVRDFFIGRVTNQVLHLARDQSVWIVQ
jgi:nucleotide-binding universal stress UspA family protein